MRHIRTLLCVIIALLLFTPVHSFSEQSNQKIYQADHWAYDYTGYMPKTNLEDVVMVFKKENTTIEISLDDFEGTIHNPKGAISYGNKELTNSDYLDVTTQKWIDVKGKQGYLNKWTRKPLQHLTKAETYYISIEVPLSETKLWSIMVKSDAAIHVDDILNRIYWPKDENYDPGYATIKKANERIKPVVSLWNTFDDPETQAFYTDQFGYKESLKWGIFEPSTIGSLKYLNQVEDKVQYEYQAVLQYYDLVTLPRISNLREIYDQDKYIELTLQTSIYSQFDGDKMFEVMDGKYDQEIDRLIDTIIELDQPVLFRPNNEMNGDWCSYNAMYYGKDASLYRDFWKFLYNRFEVAGADKVIWVWNANWGDFPEFKWNHYMKYWPGDQYVDLVGLTGYNTGNYYVGEKWASFEEIYYPMLIEYNKRFRGYPYIITEFGSSDVGGDKKAWMIDMMDKLKTLNVKLAIWWNGVDYDHKGKPARTYRFTHDEDLVNTMKDLLKDFEDSTYDVPSAPVPTDSTPETGDEAQTAPSDSK